MVRPPAGVAADGPRAVGWGRQPPPGLRRPPSRPPTISVTGSMTGVNSGGTGRGVVGTGGGSVVDGAGGGDVVPGGREADDDAGPAGAPACGGGEVYREPPDEPPSAAPHQERAAPG